MKILQQPQITQAEINSIERYHKDVSENGYRPWKTVRQSNTHGQGQEIWSHVSDRGVHLYSRGERGLFVVIERLPNLIDIREQMPLPIDETLELAKELNILHPGAYAERQEHGGIIPAKTMTSDIVAIFQTPDGEITPKVFSFKYASSLDGSKNTRSVNRTWDKLKLERSYWQRQNVDWVLVTDQCLDPDYIYNLEYLRQCFDFAEVLEDAKGFYFQFIRRFTDNLTESPQLTLMQLLEILAGEFDLPLYQSEAIFQHAAYKNDLKLNLYKRIELYRPLPQQEMEASHAA